MTGHDSSDESSSDEDSDDSNTVTMWEIFNLSSTGVLDWSNPPQFTPDIAGYELSLSQDLDGDGYVGVNLSTLTDVSTDTVGAQLKISESGLKITLVPFLLFDSSIGLSDEISPYSNETFFNLPSLID